MHRSWRMSVESVLYVDADVRSGVCVYWTFESECGGLAVRTD